MSHKKIDIGHKKLILAYLTSEYFQMIIFYKKNNEIKMLIYIKYWLYTKQHVTQGRMHGVQFCIFLWPCLVPFQNTKIFKISRHIEYLDACMKH